MSNLSKLQIRAKVLSVISEIKSISSFSSDVLKKMVEDLGQISDREALFDIFIKEFIKMEEEEYTFSACLLKELVSKEYVSDNVFDALKSSAYSDDSKYKLVQLLRVVGASCDYNELPSYFDNPNEVLDLETKKLLEKAVFNPEAMLDFLDFVSAVSSRDRKLLLDSLSLDYKGDVLANIIYPILYSDFSDDFILDVIEILADSKSSLAIAPFNYLIEVSSNPDVVNACKVGLKKLKLSGASIEKANEYFCNIIMDSIPAELFATIPDGNGNQAILISRANLENKYLLGAIVVNDVLGVVDCFGFYNIAQDELIKVLAKFYQNEGKYRVSAEYVKSQISKAIELTIKNKRKFPYEFICWSPLFADMSPLEEEISSLIKDDIVPKSISKDAVLNLLTKEYTLRWYITTNENHFIKNIVDYIYSSDSFDISEINLKVKETLNEIFDLKTSSLWLNRFYNLIYLLIENSEKADAEQFYSLVNNEEHFRLFKSVLVQRSIFNSLVALYENSKDSFFTANIFKKRNSSESKYNSKKLMSIIEKLQASWLNG